MNRCLMKVHKVCALSLGIYYFKILRKEGMTIDLSKASAALDVTGLGNRLIFHLCRLLHPAPVFGFLHIQIIIAELSYIAR